MSDLSKHIDARTRLAGANKLEVLTFSLGVDARSGREETFGINVFKVREVIKTPEITAAPSMPAAVKGMVSLRGQLIPVVDLGEYVGVEGNNSKEVLILTEYNGKAQGFLVHAVDTILRISWSDMRVPPQMIAGNLRGLVTSVTELPENKLVMMLDVERVLSELSPSAEEELAFQGIQKAKSPPSGLIFFADDSVVARTQIQKTLDAMGLEYRYAMNGREAWEQISKIADGCAARGASVKSALLMILTDIEMPEMDGFALTKKIKADPRFAGVPVVMHSSLSGSQNQTLGQSVGVDEYISKFEPQRLATAIRSRLGI